MKLFWIDAYNEKFDECIEEGMTTDQADQEAIEWADGVFERLQDPGRRPDTEKW